MGVKLSNLKPRASIDTISCHNNVEAVTSETPHREYAGIFIGCLVVCRDEFISKFTGEMKCKWRAAEITAVDGLRVRAHFSGWSKKYDVWINLEADGMKLAPLRLLSKKQKELGLPLTEEQIHLSLEFLVSGHLPPGYEESNDDYDDDASDCCLSEWSQSSKTTTLSNISSSINSASGRCNRDTYVVGQRVHVQDIYRTKKKTLFRKWRDAEIIDIKGSFITTHFIGWESKWDLVIDMTKHRDRIRQADGMVLLGLDELDVDGDRDRDRDDLSETEKPSSPEVGSISSNGSTSARRRSTGEAYFDTEHPPYLCTVSPVTDHRLVTSSSSEKWSPRAMLTFSPDKDSGGRPGSGRRYPARTSLGRDDCSIDSRGSGPLSTIIEEADDSGGAGGAASRHGSFRKKSFKSESSRDSRYMSIGDTSIDDDRYSDGHRHRGWSGKDSSSDRDGDGDVDMDAVFEAIVAATKKTAITTVDSSTYKISESSSCSSSGSNHTLNTHKGSSHISSSGSGHSSGSNHTLNTHKGSSHISSSGSGSGHSKNGFSNGQTASVSVKGNHFFKNNNNNHNNDHNNGNKVMALNNIDELTEKRLQSLRIRFPTSPRGEQMGCIRRSKQLEDSFLDRLHREGLRVFAVVPDCHCLFRAVAYQLFGTEDRHRELRLQCAEHMHRHRERFEVFCSGSLDDRLSRLRDPLAGQSGDDLEIRALEELVDRVCFVYSMDTYSEPSSSSSPTVSLSPTPTATAPKGTNVDECGLLEGVAPLRIVYYGNSLYNAVVDEKATAFPLERRSGGLLQRERQKLFQYMFVVEPGLNV